MSQFELLRRPRFAAFFWTQFLGALNDNVFKNALVIALAFGVSATAFSADTLVNLAGGIFILPFFLFSGTAGEIADKFDKARVIRAVKLFEIVIMSIGAVGFARGSAALLFTALFMMGVHSTLFGPVKYSILPQHLRKEELIGGNALVEMGTFVAILTGTILGGVLIGVAEWGTTLTCAATVGLAVAGWIVSQRVPPAPAPTPDLTIHWNPIRQTLRAVGYARANRTVFLSILGISWFWFYGALFMAQVPSYGREVLGGNEHVVTLLLTIFSVGVGLGCLLCERLSGGTIEIGLVPLGSIGLSIFGFDLFLATPTSAVAAASLGLGDFWGQPGSWRILVDLALIGFSGGLFIVPLLALVQNRSEPTLRSQTIAGNNIINAGFMVVAALIGVGLRTAGLDIPQVFAVAAVVNAAVAVYIYTLVPEFLMRLLVWLLVRTVYRFRYVDLSHIPAEGPAVLVCNHVSFVDALVIAAACRRPIRFVMDHNIFRMPVLSFVFRTARAIPIASRKEDPRLVEAAFDEVAAALAEGELVCIFPEGQITRTGDLNPFRPGVERIIARTPVPVVPIALRGLWGSFFSRKDGPAMHRPFRRVWSRIELVCGLPVSPSEATAANLEGQVRALRGEAR